MFGARGEPCGVGGCECLRATPTIILPSSSYAPPRYPVCVPSRCLVALLSHSYNIVLCPPTHRVRCLCCELEAFSHSRVALLLRFIISHGFPLAAPRRGSSPSGFRSSVGDRGVQQPHTVPRCSALANASVRTPAFRGLEQASGP